MAKKSDAELDAMAARIDQSNSQGDYTRNDTGNAARLIDAHREEMYWVPAGKGDGDWYLWDGERWRPDADGMVTRWAHQIAEGILDEAHKAYKDADGNEEAMKAARAFIRWATGCGNRSQIRSMIELAKTLDKGRTVPASYFDSSPQLLGAENGVLELGEGVVAFGPAERDDYIARSTGVPYLPGAKSELWTGYLRTFLPERELRQFVQKVIGYGMYGRNDEKLMVFLQGAGNTGKTTLANMIMATFGDYAAVMNMTVMRGKFDNGNRDDLANIVRARFAVASESGAEWELHADQVKRLSGGDPIAYERKWAGMETVMPEFLPIVATNSAPRVKGADKATYNRLCVIPFNHAAKKTSDAGSRMAADPEAKAAFLAWAVRGWNLYREEGLSRETWPEAVRVAGREYETEMSDVATFIAERCEVGPELFERAGELYATYQTWCEVNGLRADSSTRFGSELAGLGYAKGQKKIEGQNTKVRKGLSLANGGPALRG